MSDKYIPYGLHNLDDEDIQAVVEILKGQTITQGPVVDQFGEVLAEYTGAKYGIPVSSGSAALHLSVVSIDIKPGDEVITCPLTFCATSNAILYQGGTPVFVDIDEKTLNIDPGLIESKINKNTKAIMPIDFRGHPAPLPEIKRLADKYGLFVIEDAAHSLGSTYTYDNRTYSCGDGIHADLCSFSFHPVKHMTTGEGGAVLTNDENLFKKIYNLKKHGIDRREEMFDEIQRKGEWVYDMEYLGYNYRMTDFQAALGISQLKKLPNNIARRIQIVDYYNENFKSIDELILPYESNNVHSNFHLYVVQIKENSKKDRYDFFYYLRSLKYRPMIHYIPVHLLGYYKNRFGYKEGDFPKAERYYKRTITLPLYPDLTDLQVQKVVDDVYNFFN